MASVNEIKNALDTVKENLILNRFNDAMMLMAQITIEVIGHLVDDNLIVSKGYEEDLKTLATSNIITDETEHNFETIIISGIQANKGVIIPKEHAEQAYEILSVEIDDVLKNNNLPIETMNDGEKARVHAVNKKENEPVFEYNEDNEEDDQMNVDSPAFFSSDEDVDFRKKERIRQELRKKETYKKKFRLGKLISLILPIILILLIIVFFKSCLFRNSSNEEQQVEITTMSLEEETSTEEETTTTEEGYYSVTGDAVRVRAQPNASGPVIETVGKGTLLYVQSFYNNEWALIRHNGRDAFISRQFIEKSPVQNIAPEFNEEQN